MKMRISKCSKGGKCRYRYAGDISGEKGKTLLRYYRCKKCSDGYAANPYKKRK